MAESSIISNEITLANCTDSRNNMKAFLKDNLTHIVMITLFCAFFSIAISLTIDVMANRSYREVKCVFNADDEPVYYTEIDPGAVYANVTDWFPCWINHKSTIKLSDPLPHEIKVLAVVFWCLTCLSLPVYTIIIATRIRKEKEISQMEMTALDTTDIKGESEFVIE